MCMYRSCTEELRAYLNLEIDQQHYTMLVLNRNVHANLIHASADKKANSELIISSFMSKMASLRLTMWANGAADVTPHGHRQGHLYHS